MRIPCYFLPGGFPVIQAQFVKITHLFSSQSHSSDTNLWCPPAAIKDLNQQSKKKKTEQALTKFIISLPWHTHTHKPNYKKQNRLHNTTTAQASTASRASALLRGEEVSTGVVHLSTGKQHSHPGRLMISQYCNCMVCPHEAHPVVRLIPS